MPERVIDASVAVKWVMKGESYRWQARKLLRESQTADITLIAPPLFESETESVIQKEGIVRRLLTELERKYPPFNRAPLRLEDLEMIVDQEGIRLFREPIPCLSCLCSYKGQPFILLKVGLSAFLQTFLLGHELGHHFFHPGLDLSLLKHTLFSRGKIEQAANAFALCALIPTPALEWLIQEKGYPSLSAIKGYLREQYGDITFCVEGRDMLDGLIQERVALYGKGRR